MTALVHRLAQRSRRPGLSRPDQGQGILDRHLSMARRSTLVDRLCTRGRAEDDVQVPIVYVQPELAGATTATPPDRSIAPAPAVTIVNVLRPPAGPVLEQRMINGQAPTTPPAAAASQMMVSSATTPPPLPAASPIWAGIPTTAGRDPAQNVEWQRSRPETQRTVEVVARETSALVVVAKPPTAGSGAAMARPAWVAPEGGAPSAISALPGVLEQRASATERTLPTVRTVRTVPTAPTLPSAVIGPRLPLVAPVVSGDRRGEETPRAINRFAPRHAAVPPAYHSPTSVSQIAPQVPAVERLAVDAIDIDRLTDTVHARLLRRLTIERERRGVMR
jgi:hypothetical protein